MIMQDSPLCGKCLSLLVAKDGYQFCTQCLDIDHLREAVSEWKVNAQNAQ